ncbi:FERM domain-containing protein 3,Band 4.1-like protein 1,Band 4.1-like protein 2,FERM domain-containing protein 5, partial [Acanthosepion pharaonis]
HWLDPVKTVYKQLKELIVSTKKNDKTATDNQSVNPMVLCFRVKFYPADPMSLHEEITRYFLFLQLRRDLHHGRLLCPPSDANLLAAYIIQSELGDYDIQDHPPGYVSQFKMLPKQTPKIEEQITEIHKTLAKQVPSEAENNFLKKAATLDTYGVDPHQVKDQKGNQLYLGITHQGIMTFHGNRRTHLFVWTQIKRIVYEGKMFIVHVHTAEKQQPIGYKCPTTSACKYLWRCAVEQQFFFTLSSSINAPKVRSGGSLLTRGSKFRFSGRCQTEAIAASGGISRPGPSFTRSSSLPNFSHKKDGKSSLRNTTMPRDAAIKEELPVDVPGQTKTEANKLIVTDKETENVVEKAPIASSESSDEVSVSRAMQGVTAAPPTEEKELESPGSAPNSLQIPESADSCIKKLFKHFLVSISFLFSRCIFNFSLSSFFFVFFFLCLLFSLSSFFFVFFFLCLLFSFFSFSFFFFLLFFFIFLLFFFLLSFFFFLFSSFLFFFLFSSFLFSFSSFLFSFSLFLFFFCLSPFVFFLLFPSIFF